MCSASLLTPTALHHCKHPFVPWRTAGKSTKAWASILLIGMIPLIKRLAWSRNWLQIMMLGHQIISSSCKILTPKQLNADGHSYTLAIQYDIISTVIQFSARMGLCFVEIHNKRIVWLWFDDTEDQYAQDPPLSLLSFALSTLWDLPGFWVVEKSNMTGIKMVACGPLTTFKYFKVQIRIVQHSILQVFRQRCWVTTCPNYLAELKPTTALISNALKQSQSCFISCS